MTILNQVVSQNPVRDGHKGGIDTGSVNPLYIDQYGGEVEHRFLKESFMRGFFNFKSVRGTDTITNDRIGHGALQKVTRGTRPTDTSPTFDNISIKVDTLVLARANQFLLDDFLSHIDVRKEIGLEHGREVGKFFDESLLVQGIKACQITSQDPSGVKSGGWEDANNQGGNKPTTIIRTAPEGHQGGTPIILPAALDELDPDLLAAAIYSMCQGIEEKDVDIMDAVILVRPAQYYALLNNDKLINKDFSSANGDYALGTVLKANGVRLQRTNRFPTQAKVGVTNFLSNAGNGSSYDVTQADADCVACLITPKALLAGETIPLTSKVYYSDVELQWFIDSYVAFGATPNRAEVAAGIFKFNVGTAV